MTIVHFIISFDWWPAPNYALDFQI